MNKFTNNSLKQISSRQQLFLINVSVVGDEICVSFPKRFNFGQLADG